MSQDDEDQRTIWCGNLSEQVTEELLFELFLQAAPLERVRIPSKEGKQSNYGFITVKHKESVEYTKMLLNGLPLYGQNINLKARNVNNSQYRPPHQNHTMNPRGNESFDTLLQMGAQMMLEHNKASLPADSPYQQSNPYNNQWGHTSSYEDHRRDLKPYSRHNHRDDNRRHGNHHNNNNNYRNRKYRH